MVQRIVSYFVSLLIMQHMVTMAENVCYTYVSLRYYISNPNYISSESPSRFYEKFVRSWNFKFGTHLDLAKPMDQNSLLLPWKRVLMFDPKLLCNLQTDGHKTAQKGQVWVLKQL